MASFGFGTQTQTPAFGGGGGGFSFGAPTSTTSTPSFASSSFSNPATNVSGSGFSFGATPTTTASGVFGTSTGFLNTSSSAFPSLGQTTATTSTSGFSFGGSSNVGNTGISFGTSMPGSAVTTTTPATVGLGGVDLQASSINGTSSTGKKDKAVKETFIPHELLTTVEAYKKYIKEQKAIREEMSRMSSKNILRVQSQVSTLRQQLSVVSNGLQRNAIAIAKLKQESSEELRNAEIIQRTKDTPPALQYENTAPAAYFHNLAISFENQMQSYRQQIEQLERHLLSLSQPSTMTPNELTVVMRRLHDAFVTLAAQLQTVHQQVQFQKEQFLALRKVGDTDMSNIFHSRKATSNIITLCNGSLPVPVTIGPSPLLLGSNAAVTAISNAHSRAQQGLTGSSFLSSPQLGFSQNFGVPSGSSFKPLGK